MSDEAMKKVSKSFPELSRSRARSLARDEGGAVAVMLVLCLGALIGMMALAVDLGKAWNVSTELQHAADACALAGATQIDGGANARIRAIRAATQGFVRNRQTFASDAVDADNDTFPDGPEVRFDTNEAMNADNITENTDIRFFKELADPLTGTPRIVAATDIDAHYIECTVQPRTVPFSFAAVVGAVDSASPTARAMAFNGAAFCQVPPLFTCAPVDEATGDLLLPGDEDIGKGIWMKGKDNPGGGSLFPGNFGLLCLTLDNGEETCKAQDISDALARVNPLNLCFAKNDELKTKTGEVTGPIKNGLNMRFGIYPNGVHKVPDGELSVTNNPQYGRTLNPVKGLEKTGGNCKENAWKAPAVPNQFQGPLVPGATVAVDGYDYAIAFDAIQAMPFPRDNCAYDPPYGDASCRPGTNDGGRFGDTGEWDIYTYMKINHSIDFDPVTSTISCSRCDAGVDPQIPTRMEVFEWERDSLDLAVSPGPLPGETGITEDLMGNFPNCGVPVIDLERRLIPIAIADCRNVSPGQTTIIAPKVMIILLTEAVGFGPEGFGDNKNIYGEITGYANIGELTTIERNIIQLTQ